MVFEKYYGLSGSETAEQLDDYSSLNLASVSKQFTAMGIVILKNKSLLEYDDEISKYIPSSIFTKESLFAISSIIPQVFLII
ncbi:hypothetical protein DN730_11175 [Marinomonas piezotolerans]|uniref:Beta-lactamase-related domain-containing protein n=1 Tax=Marinomonas piezotolerans TaxID=2213058 RepID=A0A370U8T4_9GAMM|nr:hypothetical protein DN730_11175 [Marinomonas piezotolerans]